MTDPHTATKYCVVGEGYKCVAYAAYMTPCREPATVMFAHDRRAKNGIAWCDIHHAPIRDDVAAENRKVLEKEGDVKT